MCVSLTNLRNIIIIIIIIKSGVNANVILHGKSLSINKVPPQPPQDLLELWIYYANNIYRYMKQDGRVLPISANDQ